MPVQCRNCGYLAKHSLSRRAPTPRFYEIDTDDRGWPQQFFKHTPDTQLGEVDTELVCFLGKADLMAECGGPRTAKPEYDERALKVIWRDRECESFYPHIPGFSPMEHQHFYRMQRLEQERREFEERLARRDEEVHTALVKAQQAFQLERERTQQEFHLERERAQEPTTNLMKRLTWLAVGLAAIQVLIGLTPESLIVKVIIKLWRLIFG